MPPSSVCRFQTSLLSPKPLAPYKTTQTNTPQPLTSEQGTTSRTHARADTRPGPATTTHRAHTHRRCATTASLRVACCCSWGLRGPRPCTSTSTSTSSSSSSMSKRGAIDRFFVRLPAQPDSRKRAKPAGAAAEGAAAGAGGAPPPAEDCQPTGGGGLDQGAAPWDDVALSPRTRARLLLQQQQEQQQNDRGTTGAGSAAPPPPAAPSGGAGSSAPQQQQQQAPANALGALMAAARGQKPQPARQPADLSLQAMADKAASNQAAAAAAARAAAAAGQPPQLSALLVEPSWVAVLGREFGQPYGQQLQRFLQQEWAAGVVYPPQESIFRAFNSVPFDQVRVVILGQDPYINVGEAMGLSFSVPPGVRVPPSLVNIYKELAADVGAAVPNHGCLEKWCHQGVLLLNAAMTVRPKQSNSHAGKGWEALTSAALTALVKQRSGIVFLLWGKYAQDRCAKLDMRHHHVLKSVHPSPLSAHRGFLGCKHFSATNKLLEAAGHAPIDWQIDSVLKK